MPMSGHFRSTLGQHQDLHQLIEHPTRVTNTLKSQIDLIFSNKPEWVTKTFNMCTGWSDHNVTLIFQKLTKKILHLCPPEQLVQVRCPHNEWQTLNRWNKQMTGAKYYLTVVGSDNLKSSCTISKVLFGLFRSGSSKAHMLNKTYQKLNIKHHSVSVHLKTYQWYQETCHQLNGVN